MGFRHHNDSMITLRLMCGRSERQLQPGDQAAKPSAQLRRELKRWERRCREGGGAVPAQNRRAQLQETTTQRRTPDKGPQTDRYPAGCQGRPWGSQGLTGGPWGGIPGRSLGCLSEGSGVSPKGPAATLEGNLHNKGLSVGPCLGSAVQRCREKASSYILAVPSQRAPGTNSSTSSTSSTSSASPSSLTSSWSLSRRLR